MTQAPRPSDLLPKSAPRPDQEARVGLVCCRGDTEQLCSELEVEIRDRNIAVFGRQDLPQLGQKFAKWVEWNG